MVDASTLKELEKKLSDNLFVKGPHPSHEDAQAFEEFTKANYVPDQDEYPSVWAWYSLMVLFEDEVVNSWKSNKQEKGEKKGKGGKHEHEEKHEEKHEKKEKHEKGKKGKKEEKKEEKDDDDFDPFADETEEDKAAKEKLKEENKSKKKEKKKEVAKSHVIFEIKGWEAEQDLDALAKKIINGIQKDGLKWNTGYKLEEVAFGIKKLIIAVLVEDDKVSVDELQEELESWEDDIQSVEIVSFNKN